MKPIRPFVWVIFWILIAVTCRNLIGAQTYYSPISINSGQVPSTQTDFPVLVSVTDARFKTIANGGHVADAEGDDIRPYTDTTLGTAITGYEKERYNATTGEVVMWVKVASCASSTTPIVLGYGDAALTTDGSSSTTWSSGFLGVWHYKDGSSLTITDSTGAYTSPVNHSATATTGKIDGGVAVASGSSRYIDEGSSSAGIINASTISGWINATSFPNSYNCWAGVLNTHHVVVLIKSTGKLAFYCWNGSTDSSYDGTGSNTLSTGTWYYIVGTYSSSTGLKGYVNASVDGTATGTTNQNSAFGQMYVGQQGDAASRFFNGSIDEVRFASVARSADWITTEYNNQSAPGTFETLGTEVSTGSNTVGSFFNSD